MAEDKDWFTRQASRTAEDIKQLPDWLRTQRNDGKSAIDDTTRLPGESDVRYAARLAQRAALTTETLRFLATCASPETTSSGFAQMTDLDGRTVRMLWEHQLYQHVRKAAHVGRLFEYLLHQMQS